MKDIVNLINNVFDGKVADFLAENNGKGILPVITNNMGISENSVTGILPVITNNMRSHFKELLNKLSFLEQQIVSELSKFEQPITREDLRQNLDLSSQDLINNLQSLQQRYLIKKSKEDKILFNLAPVFKEYLRGFSIHR